MRPISATCQRCCKQANLARTLGARMFVLDRHNTFFMYEMPPFYIALTGQAMFAVMPPMPWLPAAGAVPHAGAQQQPREAAAAGPAAAPSGGAAAAGQQQQTAGAPSAAAAPSSAAAASSAAGATSMPSVHTFPGQQGEHYRSQRAAWKCRHFRSSQSTGFT